MADNALVQALQVRVAQLEARLPGQAGEAGEVAATPKMLDLGGAAGTANVPLLNEFVDLPHSSFNPVQRGHRASSTASLLDMGLERGMFSAAAAGPAVKKEYEAVGSALSYLWDLAEVLVQQCSSSDIPAARRKSLSVPISALQQVVRLLEERRDLPIAKGEFKTSPELVKAMELGMNGISNLPVTSSKMQGLMDKTMAVQMGYLQKQSAKAAAPPARGSGGAGSSSVST
eukprot:gene14938-15143_t